MLDKSLKLHFYILPFLFLIAISYKPIALDAIFIGFHNYFLDYVLKDIDSNIIIKILTCNYFISIFASWCGILGVVYDLLSHL